MQTLRLYKHSREILETAALILPSLLLTFDNCHYPATNLDAEEQPDGDEGRALKQA